MNYIANYFKTIGAKRVVTMILGNVFMSLGVALFKLSSLGNDPFNGMNMSLAAVLSISYPLLQVIVNVVFFIMEFLWGRKYIGIGTIFNALLVGYIVSFFYGIFESTLGITFSMPQRLFLVVIGVIICCFGISVYQQSDVGIAPYDSLALMMDERFKRVPYFWCRMLCDGTCTLVIFFTGGILGIGTLVTAFGLGPVIHFFDRTVTRRYIIKSRE